MFGRIFQGNKTDKAVVLRGVLVVLAIEDVVNGVFRLGKEELGAGDDTMPAGGHVL